MSKTIRETLPRDVRLVNIHASHFVFEKSLLGL